ncbi:sigma-70 family RNA polymerase sigma factor [Allorhizocola rhizosphaerae]|uniref:sigma-70 family RNA polymerase sigma factor n=1 Tax=Allorhizocola rhizosphaerae TaxID=1872709 RepID=UPI000E3B7EF2
MTRPEAADFAGFYAANFAKIGGQLAAYLGDQGEAQDVTQEAFCRAFERWERISTYEHPEAWVRQVAWNLATNRLRHLRVVLRHRASQREEHVEGPTPDRVALTRALAKLPPKHRLAVVLHHLGQLSTSEIAQQQNVAEGTVRSWLTRGRSQLAEQLTWESAPVVAAPGIDKTISTVRRRRAARRATLAAVIAIVLALPIAITLWRGKGSEPPVIGPTTPPTSPSPSVAPSARQVIARLSVLAENAPNPPEPRPDQLILVVQTQYSSVGAHQQERWLDPNGAILLRTRIYEAGDFVEEDTEQERQRWINMSRADMAKLGPGLFYPTWAVLSTYTTDPQALLHAMTHGRTQTAGEVAHTLGTLAEEMDAMAPPRLKAALLRALALVDGVTAELVTAPDGSRVWAIGGQESENRRREVLVSETTGQVVGYRDLALAELVFPSGRPCPLCTPPFPEPSRVPIPPTPTSTYLWQASLVDR